MSQYEGFSAACLNPYVLWASMVSLNDRERARLPEEDNIPNWCVLQYNIIPMFNKIYIVHFVVFRTYRYAAYRQFSWFIYTKFGRHVRRVIPPACVVTKIREEFPEPSGVYVNFDGDDEGADGVSEIIEAWEYMES